MRVLSQSSLCLEWKTGFSCTLISPAICRQFIKPTHHEVLEFSWEKKAGVPLHICDYIDPIIEDILNFGIAVLSLSPSWLKRMIGISQKKIFQVGVGTKNMGTGNKKKQKNIDRPSVPVIKNGLIHPRGS